MEYKIHLLSDWHVGSGLGAGAETDSEILKDDNNLPYIPGKTIKGLLKDALMEMASVDQADMQLIRTLFGYYTENKENEQERELTGTLAGNLFFSNATLPKMEQQEIVPELANFLYRNITSTQINKSGVARNNSLRTMEICMPVTLIGQIICNEEGTEREVHEAEYKIIQKAMKWVRHLGMNRNRGLGRCQFVELIKGEANDR